MVARSRTRRARFPSEFCTSICLCLGFMRFASWVSCVSDFAWFHILVPWLSERAPVRPTLSTRIDVGSIGRLRPIEPVEGLPLIGVDWGPNTMGSWSPWTFIRNCDRRA
eukprot:scaffold682_cov363-Pavlova_lutheri.AAC.48